MPAYYNDGEKKKTKKCNVNTLHTHTHTDAQERAAFLFNVYYIRNIYIRTYISYNTRAHARTHGYYNMDET
jgi:hypothetical protein